MKPWLKKLFGTVKAEIEAAKESTPGDDASVVPSPAGRRGKHSDHPRKSMRRGVQLSLERKQRAGRLELIGVSQRDGVRIAKLRRTEQLAKREVPPYHPDANLARSRVLS